MPLEQPDTKRLLEELELQTIDTFNDLQSRRLKKQADSLFNSDAAGAYMVHGIISSFENDIDGIHKNFKTSILNRPNSKVVYYNYANSLRKVREYSLAIEMFGKALALPDDRQNEYRGFSIVAQMVATLYVSGSFIKAAELIQEHNLTQEDLNLAGVTVDSVEIACSFMKKMALSDQDMALYSDAVAKASPKLEFIQILNGMYVDLSPDGSELICELAVDLPSSEIALMNSQLSTELSKVEMPIQALLNVTYWFDAA